MSNQQISNPEQMNLTPKELPSRQRIIVIAVALIIGMAFGTIAFIFTRYQLLNNQIESNFESNITRFDNDVQLLLNSIDTNLQIVGAEVRLGATPEELSQIMSDIVERFPQIFAIIVTDADGTVISDSRPDNPSIGISLADREHVIIHQNEQLNHAYVAPVVRARTTDEWSVPISWGVHDADGNLQAVVITGVVPQRFASEITTTENISGAILDRNRRILVPVPFNEEEIGTPLTDEQATIQETILSQNSMTSDLIITTKADTLTAYRMYNRYDTHLIFWADKSGNVVEFYRESALITASASLLMIAILIALFSNYRTTYRMAEQTASLQLETAQRKIAEQAVWKERNLLRTLIDNVPDYIFIKDAEGRFLESNRAHTAATGLTYQQILNRTAHDLFDESLASQFQKDDDYVLKEGQTITNQERTTISPDGEQRWVLTSKLPLYTGSNITGLVGISRDITDRRQAENELRASEERLQTIVSNLPAIIIECNPYGLIELIDGKAIKLIGINPEQHMHTHITDLYGAYIDDLETILTNVLAGEEQTHRMTIGDYTFSMHFIPRKNENGQVMSIITIANDITATLNAERLHHDMQRERDLIQLKERFIATASHDFRTPLTIIKTKADFLIRYHDRIEKSDRITKLTDIKWQVDHMNALLENILTLSEANLGNLEPQTAPLELKIFCERVWADMLEAASDHSHTDFTYEATTQIIHADEHLLQYALINVLSNAFKYTPTDQPILFKITEDADHICFNIQDKGIGIPEADVTNLFEPFFRASNSPSGKGKGLGLSIVKAYIEAHNGTITIDSAEDEGTCVKINLPKR